MDHSAHSAHSLFKLETKWMCGAHGVSDIVWGHVAWLIHISMIHHMERVNRHSITLNNAIVNGVLERYTVFEWLGMLIIYNYRLAIYMYLYCCFIKNLLHHAFQLIDWFNVLRQNTIIWYGWYPMCVALSSITNGINLIPCSRACISLVYLVGVLTGTLARFALPTPPDSSFLLSKFSRSYFSNLCS